jgi:hypothetical protein
MNIESRVTSEDADQPEIASKDIKKNNLLDRFKRKFTEIFEENDTAM